ncbi:unnamed protein product [Caretta caretta]
MGDFNYSCIDWVCVTSHWDREIIFLETINDCFLEQLVLEPKRGEAIPDKVLSGAQDFVQEVNVAEPLHNSHYNRRGQNAVREPHAALSELDCCSQNSGRPHRTQNSGRPRHSRLWPRMLILIVSICKESQQLVPSFQLVKESQLGKSTRKRVTGKSKRNSSWAPMSRSSIFHPENGCVSNVRPLHIERKDLRA